MAKKFRGTCVYTQVMIQMCLRGWDNHDLAQKAGLNYTSLRRKLRGETALRLDEARRIQEALDCGLPLEELFAPPSRQDNKKGAPGKALPQ